MSMYCSSSKSLQFSEDQDSFDNIVIEEKKSNHPNSSKSLSNFDEEEIIFNQEDNSNDEMEFEDNQNIDCSQEEILDRAENEQKENLLILKKIQEKKKNIFQLIHKTQLKNIQNSGESKHLSSAGDKKSSQIFKREIFNYNRREKSLEELSKKFLSLFLDKEESLLSLDKITTQLGVERRRIYDIINILESLKLVSRQGKNNYKWNGFKKIYRTINQFDTSSVHSKEEQELIQEPQKREKSLEMLSIGFLKLFLHWKHTMTLEEAARKLSLKMIDNHKIKTKIRRLYDIANVFKSLGLIKKTSLTETKKPAFEWVGIEGLNLFVQQTMNKCNSNVQQKIKEDQNDDKNNLLYSQTQQKQSCKSNYELLSVKKRLQSDKFQINSLEEIGEKKQLKKSFILNQQMKEQQEKQKFIIQAQQSNLQQQYQQNINSNPNIQLTTQPSFTNSSSNIMENIPVAINTICQNFTNQQFGQQFSSVFQNNTPSTTQSQLQLFPNYLSEQQQPENNQNKINQNLNEKFNQNNNQNFNNNLLENLMIKCFENALSNILTKNISKNINDNQTIQQNSMQDLNQFKQVSPQQYQNENVDIYKNNQQNSQNNNNITKSSIKNSSQKCFNNLSDFTTAKKSKEDLNQIINDENIPNSVEKSRISSLQNKLSFSNLKNNNLKTPILKKALTIIQPRHDEYEDITPTPPQLKRSFSVYLQQGNTTTSTNKNKSFQNHTSNISRTHQIQNYSNIFADKTNNYTQTNQNNQIESNSDIFQQSSFKKIRKLTYENNLLDESDNKQNNLIKNKQITFNSLLQNSYSQINNNNINNINNINNNNIQDIKDNNNYQINNLSYINNNLLSNQNIFSNSY